MKTYFLDAEELKRLLDKKIEIQEAIHAPIFRVMVIRRQAPHWVEVLRSAETREDYVLALTQIVENDGPWVGDLD